MQSFANCQDGTIQTFYMVTMLDWDISCCCLLIQYPSFKNNILNRCVILSLSLSSPLTLQIKALQKQRRDGCKLFNGEGKKTLFFIKSKLLKHFVSFSICFFMLFHFPGTPAEPDRESCRTLFFFTSCCSATRMTTAQRYSNVFGLMWTPAPPGPWGN